jgi:hypothetical protein
MSMPTGTRNLATGSSAPKHVGATSQAVVGAVAVAFEALSARLALGLLCPAPDTSRVEPHGRDSEPINPSNTRARPPSVQTGRPRGDRQGVKRAVYELPTRLTSQSLKLQLRAELIPKAPRRRACLSPRQPLRTQARMFCVSAHPKDYPLRRNASCFLKPATPVDKARGLGQGSGAAFVGVILVFAKAVH